MTVTIEVNYILIDVDYEVTHHQGGDRGEILNDVIIRWDYIPDVAKLSQEDQEHYVIEFNKLTGDDIYNALEKNNYI